MKSSLRRHTALLTIANGFTRGLGFLLRMAFARLMSAEALGLMEMAASVGMLAATPVAAGVPTAVSRMTAQHPDCDRENVIRSALSYIRRAAAVLCPLVLTLSPLLAWLLGDTRTLPALLAHVPTLFLCGMCGVYSGYCFGLEKPGIPARCECAEQALRFTLAIALLLLFQGREAGLMAALPGAAEALAGVFVWMLFRRAVPLPRRHTRPSAALRRELTALAAPMMLSRLCATGLRAFDAVLLPVCLRRSGLSQAAATAQFGLLNGMAMPLIMAPGIVTGALCTVSTPVVSRLEKEPALLRRLMRRLNRSALLIGLGAMAGLFVLADFAGTYLFHQAALPPLLRVLCPLTLLMSLRQVQFGMVAGLGLQAKALPGTLLSSAVSLLLTAMLCPLPAFRLYGACFAAMAGQAVATLWNACLLRRAAKSENGKKVPLTP